MDIIKRYIYEFKKYKFTYFTALLIAIVVNLLSNITPFFIRELTTIITEQDFSKGYLFLALLFASFFLKNILNNLTSYMQDITLTKVSVSLQKKVFAKLHELDFEFYSNKSSGSLISALKRGDSALFEMYYGIHDSLFEAIISFIFLAVSFSFISPKYVIVAVVISSLMFVLSYYLVKYNIKTRIILNDQDDKISAIRVDNMINFETVKYFGNEFWEQNKLKIQLESWYNALRTFFISFRIIELIVGNISNIGLVLFYWIAYSDLKNGLIDLPQFLFIITFASAVFPNFWRVVRALREIAKNQADLQKYFEILNFTAKVKDPVNPRLFTDDQFSVEFNDVSFKYKKGSNALTNFNLKINAGESIAFVGYSGAGKTTIVKLLMRFFDVQKGNIKINGVDIRDVNKSYLRQQIGVVPQEPILFNDTIEYNIKYGKSDATVEELENASKIAEIYTFINSLEDKYQTPVGERGVKLSGGQKQRLAIARVLLKNSKIIIFDEATSNLDSQSEKLIQEAFWKLAKGKTTIIIAHRLSTIMHSDKIVVIDKGQIKEIGRHDELIIKDNGIYKKLWELQKNGLIGDNEQ